MQKNLELNFYRIVNVQFNSEVLPTVLKKGSVYEINPFCFISYCN